MQKSLLVTVQPWMSRQPQIIGERTIVVGVQTEQAPMPCSMKRRCRLRAVGLPERESGSSGNDGDDLVLLVRALAALEVLSWEGEDPSPTAMGLDDKLSWTGFSSSYRQRRRFECTGS